MKRIFQWLARRASRRLEKDLSNPDVVIGRQNVKGPYLLRWHLIPRNPFLNVYLHNFRRSDVDFALHDHPWLFNLSYVWSGRMYEWEPWKPDIQRHGLASACKHPVRRHLIAGEVKFRWGRCPHRIEIPKGVREVWTIFITGPRIRKWGFWCPKGWMAFDDLTRKTGKEIDQVKGCP